MNNEMVKPHILESEVSYNGFFQLKKHKIQYRKFDGSQSGVHHREVLVRAPTVAILMYDKRIDSILLTEQFRVGPLENGDHPWLFELPAGIVEEKEDKRIAIRREVFEETGYSCDAEKFLGEFYLSPGGTNETTTLFFADVELNTSGVHGATGENEDIKTHILSFTEANEIMIQGKLSAITGLALMWLKASKHREKRYV